MSINKESYDAIIFTIEYIRMHVAVLSERKLLAKSVARKSILSDSIVKLEKSVNILDKLAKQYEKCSEK